MLEKIKKLRELTKMGLADCKKALTETDGDLDKAVEVLKERSAAILAKKSEGREASEGVIETYVHFSNTMGAIVEVNCETDFVAKEESFKAFVKDLATHIAAVGPKYISVEDVPAAELEGKSDEEQKAYIQESVLMVQNNIKNPSQTIEDTLNEVGGKFREKVVIKRFTRYALGA